MPRPSVPDTATPAGGLSPAIAAQLELFKARSASALAAIRVVGAMAWLAIGLGSRQESFPLQLPWTVGYLATGVVLLLALWRRPGLRRYYWYALVVLDCPMILLTQRAALPQANPAGILAFAALFVSLMLFWFALLEPRTWLIAACTLAMGVLQSALLYTPELLRPDYLGYSLLGLILGAASGRVFGHQFTALADRAIRQQLRSERLGRYFSKDVRQQILAQEEAGPVESEVTVLFADLRGFTALSDGRASTEVFRWIDEFLGVMAQVVFQAGGTVDKFLGDGMMAYFGAPVPRPDHPSAAVDCALAMQEALSALNGRRQARGEPPLKMGIGLHLGMVAVGTLGPPERREFTLLGDAVNVASRLEGITKTLGVTILASEQVRARAPGFDWLDFDEATLRGKAVKVLVFSPARNLGVQRDRGSAA